MAAIEQKQIAAGSGACRGTDRTRRFLARIDAHLRSLAGDRERRAFLERQLEGWECRYARFIATQGASEFSASSRDPPHAADFFANHHRARHTRRRFQAAAAQSPSRR